VRANQDQEEWLVLLTKKRLRMFNRLKAEQISEEDLQKLLDAPLWIGTPRVNTLPSPADSRLLRFERFCNGEMKTQKLRLVEAEVDTGDMK